MSQKAAAKVIVDAQATGPIKLKLPQVVLFIEELADLAEMGNGLTLYDIERVEVVKGPNAVFAGISNPGGTVNLIKMKPSFTPQTSVDVSYGSYSHKRAVFRTTAPLVKDKLAHLFGVTT